MPNLGVVMDPIASIKPAKDTTLAMLLEAQRRGYTLTYFEISDLAVRDGQSVGRGRSLRVADDAIDWFTLGEATVAPLRELDVMLMRKDPPVDTAFLYATHVLTRAEAEGVHVVNRPSSCATGMKRSRSRAFRSAPRPR